MTDIIQSMLENLQDYRVPPPPSQEERSGALNAYTNAVRTVGVDRREPIDVMAAGMLTAKNPFDAQQSGAAAFNALGNWGATQRESVAKRETLATKAIYDDIVKQEGEFNKDLSLLARADAASKRGGSAPVVKVVDGKLVKYDPLTGQTEVLAGTQDQQKNKLYGMFYKAAVEQNHPNPEEYASQQTEQTLRGFGGMTVTGATNNIPGALSTQPETLSADTTSTGAPVQVKLDNMTPEALRGVPAEDLMQLIMALPPEQQAQALRWAKQATVATNPQLADKRAQQVAGLVYKDKPKSKMEEEAAAGVGKSLAKEFESLRDASSASSQLKIQLNTLKNLYSTPNMPEGKLGEEIQGVRSGLKSLGIDVGPEVAVADLASAIAGKMALLTRTAEGGNLMPGAMSDFEQKILRGLVPGLGSTAEGRSALIEFLGDMADVRIRMATEANKMATANRGVPSSNWYERRDRILKEEQARLAVKARELASRFQGAK